jgi:hypothetical protein
MPFIITQQVQPAAIMWAVQSQQLWIIAQQSLSPLVQVMQTPSLVISHLHMPIVKAQQYTIIPFIMQQQQHWLPIRDMHRFCSVPQATLSSQTQLIFMPPVHFSIVTLQRGTIIVGMLGIEPVIGIPMPGIVPGIPMFVVIGFIIVVIMIASPRCKFAFRAAGWSALLDGKAAGCVR